MISEDNQKRYQVRERGAEIYVVDTHHAQFINFDNFENYKAAIVWYRQGAVHTTSNSKYFKLNRGDLEAAHQACGELNKEENDFELKPYRLVEKLKQENDKLKLQLQSIQEYLNTHDRIYKNEIQQFIDPSIVHE